MWFRRSLVGWNSLEEFKSTGYSHPIKVRVPGIVYTEVLFQEFFRCLYNVFLCDPVDLKKLVVRAGLPEPVLHADALHDALALYRVADDGLRLAVVAAADVVQRPDDLFPAVAIVFIPPK